MSNIVLGRDYDNTNLKNSLDFYLSLSDKVHMTTTNQTVLVLRTCNGDLTSKNNFTYPQQGPVQCPDWQPTAECGNGLHGLLWGQGDGVLLNWSQDAKWLVLRVEAGDIVDLKDKVKFPKGEVVHCGDQLSATAYLLANSPADKARAVVGAHVSVGHREFALVGYKGHATAGDGGQATAGDGGHATTGINGQAIAGNYGQATAGNYGHATAGINGQATAGNYGQAIAGNYGQAIAGNYGQAIAGNYGQAIAGNYGQATAGNYGQATAGDEGQATAGYMGQATAGDRGHATAGYMGQATAGDRGQATAGDRGHATAGDRGTISIKYWDSQANRYRVATGYVGEDGIEANVAYKVENGKLVKV